MIILDTNIVSELMKAAPEAKVVNWIQEQVSSDLFITTITIAEIAYGLQSLPHGNRQKNLEALFYKTITILFQPNKILSFDTPAAEIYGRLMAHRKALGKPMTVCDGQIASITQAHQAILATRNIKDFVDCHLELVNPF